MNTDEETTITDEEIAAANLVADEVFVVVDDFISTASSAEEVDYVAVVFSIWHQLSNILLECGWTAKDLGDHLVDHAEALGPDVLGNC